MPSTIVTVITGSVDRIVLRDAALDITLLIDTESATDAVDTPDDEGSRSCTRAGPDGQLEAADCAPPPRDHRIERQRGCPPHPSRDPSHARAIHCGRPQMAAGDRRRLGPQARTRSLPARAAAGVTS